MSDVYFKKYLKYKNKYLNLKKFIDKNVNHLSGGYGIQRAEKVFNNETLREAVKKYYYNEEAAKLEYGDINEWNVSQVTNMSGLFQSKESFNGNINSWDVRNVTNMSSMFYNAKSFNQPLDNWNVSCVTEMERMFMHASKFNQDISM